MKLNRFFMLGLAGLAFAACSNEDNPAVGGDGSNKTMIVSVAGIGAGTTKAAGPVDKWTPDANEGAAVTNINSLSLLFTDANGVIKYKYEGNKTDAADEWNALFSTAGVKFVGLTGVTQVHAIANVPTGVDVPDVNENISDLATISYDLQGLGEAGLKSGVVYLGSDVEITPLMQEPAPGVTQEVSLPGAGEEGNFYYTAAIELVPIVSRIQINNITIETSGSTTFPEQAVGSITANKFTLKWSNFKPTLHGVYLNNFAPAFNGFAGTVGAMLKNDSFVNTVTGGQWLFSAEDYVEDAAYVNYVAPDYGTLLAYGTEDAGKTPLTIDAGKCLAFNVFVPFDPTTGTATAIANPTIHFQFAKDVTGYATEFKLTEGNADVTDQGDLDFIATASTALSYKLPTLNSGYLFANVSKLLTTEGGTAEVTLAPGKIYNMDVTISPVNMTIDFDNPQSYNVVVTVTVVQFTEENIYPGLD